LLTNGKIELLNGRTERVDCQFFKGKKKRNTNCMVFR
jgi:hypothetical protein